MKPTLFATPLNHRERRFHKRRNLASSLLVVAAMLGLLALCAGLIAGPQAIVCTLAWLVVGAAANWVYGPSAMSCLRRYPTARTLRPWEIPELQPLLVDLAARAELSQVPTLHYVPTALPNAFAVGTRRAPHIVITDGLLRLLSKRELTGVLAHEMSHLRNNDLWMMTLAAIVARVTQGMALFGLALLMLGFSHLLSGENLGFLAAAASLLATAPGIAWLQQALSRARECEADLDAANLTRDPAGLAAALTKLGAPAPGLWHRFWRPAKGSSATWASHPQNAKRVDRLLALRAVEPTTSWATRRVNVPWLWSPQGRPQAGTNWR